MNYTTKFEHAINKRIYWIFSFDVILIVSQCDNITIYFFTIIYVCLYINFHKRQLDNINKLRKVFCSQVSVKLIISQPHHWLETAAAEDLN